MTAEEVLRVSFDAVPPLQGLLLSVRFIIIYFYYLLNKIQCNMGNGRVFTLTSDDFGLVNFNFVFVA